MLADSFTLLFPGTFFILFSSFMKLKTLPVLLLGPRSPGVSPITTDKQLTALNRFYLANSL
jgi:hypothetical protein